MKNDGNINWYVSFTGTNPTDNSDQDRSKGVAYNQATFNVAVLIQGKMGQLRGSAKGDFYDTILILLDQSGEVKSAVTITQGTNGYDMYSASNGIINKPGLW